MLRDFVSTKQTRRCCAVPAYCGVQRAAVPSVLRNCVSINYALLGLGIGLRWVVGLRWTGLGVRVLQDCVSTKYHCVRRCCTALGHCGARGVASLLGQDAVAQGRISRLRSPACLRDCVVLDHLGAAVLDCRSAWVGRSAAPLCLD